MRDERASNKNSFTHTHNKTSRDRRWNAIISNVRAYSNESEKEKWQKDNSVPMPCNACCSRWHKKKWRRTKKKDWTKFINRERMQCNEPIHYLSNHFALFVDMEDEKEYAMCSMLVQCVGVTDESKKKRPDNWMRQTLYVEILLYSFNFLLSSLFFCSFCN